MSEWNRTRGFRALALACTARERHDESCSLALAATLYGNRSTMQLDKVTDDRALRRCLEGLATSFALPRAQVTLLRQVAQHLLVTSPQFLAAMKLGKSVVTANKALLAEHGEQIHRVSRDYGADLFYEASVAGAIARTAGRR